MASVGSLQVILECDDGNFTTRIVRAGSALKDLEGKAQVTVNTVQNVTNKMSSGVGAVMGWTIALGEAREAAETLHAVFGRWVEKIVEVNSEIEQTTALLAGFSQAATQVDRLKEGLNSVNSVLNMASQSPFSFKALEDTFVKMKTAGVEPLNGSMKSLTDAIAAFGGDDQRLTRAGYAIQEMAGRGVVSLQNLRRQLGQDIPGAVKAMAESMYMTVEQLDTAVTKGTLDSKNAITLMLDEFDRLYGGAGLARMNTFRGQVAQLSTEMMRLAMVAGGSNEGADPNQSFYRSLVKGMADLNAELASPEMTAAGVSINNFLKNLVDGAKSLIPILPTLANNIGTLAKALELLAAVLLAKGLGAALEALGATWVKLASGAGSLVSMLTGVPARVASVFGAITRSAGSAIEAVTALGTRMLALPGMTSAAEVTSVVGIGAFGQFAAGLAAVLIPATAVAGAIYLISENLERIPGQAALAGDALKRMRQGDVTPGNQDKAAEELKQLREKVALLKQQEDVVTRIQNGQGTDGRSLIDVGGAFGQKGSPALTQLFDQLSSNLQATGGTWAGSDEDLKALLGKIQGEIKAELKADSDELAVYEADLAAAPFKLAKERASRLVEDIRVQISTDFQRISSTYREQIDKINQQREELAKNPAGNQQGLLNLNSAQVDVTKQLYAQRETDLKEHLAKVAAMMTQDAQNNNQTLLAEHRVVYEALQEDLKKTQDEANAALARLGIVKTSDNTKDFTKQTNQAKTLIENLQAQVASLKGQLDDSGAVAAKIASEFSNTGRFNLLGGINSEQGQQAETLARQVDDLRAAIKRLHESVAAGNQIHLGLDKADAELNAYVIKLSDPNMTDAQTKFVLFQNQMEEAIMKMMKAMKVGEEGADQYATALLNASSAAQDAVAKMHAATALGQLEALVKQAHNMRINSLPPAQRAAAQNKDFQDHLQEAISTIDSSTALNAGQKLQARMQAQKAATDYEAGAQDRIAKAGENAARPGANAVAQLKARIAELRGEVTGGSSELAKWNSLIDSEPKKYAAVAAELRQYAGEVDNLNKQLKIAREANQAAKNIQDRLTKSTQGADLEKQYAGMGKMLDIEKQLYDYKLKNQLDLTKFAANPSNASKLPEEQAKVDQANAAEGLRLIRQRVEANSTAELTIRRGYAETTAEKRLAANQQVDDEQAALKRLISFYVKDANEKTKLENQTASYIAAKRKELEDKTRNALEKQADDWKLNSDTIINFEAQATSQLVDDLATKLATGKAHWTDFANWAIQEIDKIALHSAMSPLEKLLGTFTDKASGWLGNTVSGWINGTGDVGEHLISVGGTVNHSGGMAGREFDTIRSLPSHVWSGAPRFHTGGYLASDEVPAILQQGEAVFTSGQLGAIGNLNHNYAFVEQALSALVSAATQITSMPQAPANVAPAPLYGANTGASVGSSGMPVTLNVQNQSSLPISAVASTPKFDGEQMVLDIVIRNVQQPGPLRNAIKSMV